MTRTEFNNIDLREVFKSERVQNFWGLEEIAVREKTGGWKHGSLLKVNKKSIVFAEDFKFELKFMDLSEVEEVEGENSIAYFETEYHSFSDFAEVFEASENMAESTKRMDAIVTDVIYYCLTRI